jgi:hypothetical protein
MCSYNLVNGTYACQNEQLLANDLKGAPEDDGPVGGGGAGGGPGPGERHSNCTPAALQHTTAAL